MIVSYENNFVFIRIPKCASTTSEYIIRESNIINPYIDICTGVEEADTYETYWAGWNGGRYSQSHILPHINTKHLHNFFPIPPHLMTEIKHLKWEQLLQTGLVTKNMECIAVLRNPLDRFLSVARFLFFDCNGKLLSSSLLSSLYGFSINYFCPYPIKDFFNVFWDAVQNIDNVKPIKNLVPRIKSAKKYLMDYQFSYTHDNATHWAIENLDTKIYEFITKHGGKINNIVRLKNMDKSVQLGTLTKDRQQKLFELYEKDLILWEKAK